MIQMKENTNTLSKIHKNILYFNLLIDDLKEPYSNIFQKWWKDFNWKTLIFIFSKSLHSVDFNTEDFLIKISFQKTQSWKVASKNL